MKYVHKQTGVCSKTVEYEIKDNKVYNVSFDGGCNGNLKGISNLIDGMEVEEVIKKLEGVTCGMRGTSCPDQLARGLKEYLKDSKK